MSRERLIDLTDGTGTLEAAKLIWEGFVKDFAQSAGMAESRIIARMQIAIQAAADVGKVDARRLGWAEKDK